MRGFRASVVVWIAFPLVASLCGCGREEYKPWPEGQNGSTSGNETQGVALGDVLASWESGKKEEAVHTLKSSVKKLKEAGERYHDKVLLQKAREMEDKAASIEAEGMTKSYRKKLRTDSLQERHQQMSK